MARRRRARGRRRRGRRGLGLKKAFNGGLVRGRMHPSVNSASPWNSYTLTTTWEANSAGIQCYTSKPMLVQVRKEIGIAADAKIDFRLTRVDMWVPPTLATSDLNFIVFSPSDWSARLDKCTESSQINWFEGWGTAVQPAHVHYVWPKSVSNIVIANGKDYTLFKCDIKAKTTYIVKFHIVWRLSDPDPRPTSTDLGNYRSMREHLTVSPEIDTDFVYVANQPGVVSPLTEQVANTKI